MKRIWILGLIALALIIFYYSGIPCNNTKIYILPFPEEPLKSIIFCVESSTLNVRQACAVESAARHNLQSKVNVFFLSSKPIHNIFFLNHSLSNINLIQTNYDNLFKRTPLEQWYQKQIELNNTIQIKDIIRLLLVWKFGGIYIDTDVIALKSLHNFKDFLIKENDSLMVDLFGFQERHMFLSLCLDYLKKDSNSVVSTTLRRTFMDLCNVAGSFANVKERQCDIQTLPAYLLFPFPSNVGSDYFSSFRASHVLNQMKDSYVIHINSNLSNKIRISLGSGTAFEEAMRSNCPLVYHSAAKTNGFI